MKLTIKILGIALLAVLAVAAVGGGIAFAQTQTPTTGFGPGWMMGGFTQTDDSRGWMNSMHQWMNASGGMHTFVWNALTEKLGLTSDELAAEVSNGKTIAQVAEEKGVSRADLIATLETAHKAALAQAVAAGYLTQEQADGILAQMAAHYEWMLDNAGAGYGIRGGRGAMLGRFGQPGSSGQFVPGGCHGSWNNGTSNPQTNP